MLGNLYEVYMKLTQPQQILKNKKQLGIPVHTLKKKKPYKKKQHKSIGHILRLKNKHITHL